MATVNLGRVGLVLKGDWDSATSYVALDVVSHDGNSWAAKRANTNVEPTTENSDDWQLMANNADLVATVQGYKEDAAASASAAADSATVAAASAEMGEEAQAMIAPTEASATASAAHAAGSYFILGGVLYRATADIAQGESIVTSDTGKNCEAVKLGNDVSYLKGAVHAIEQLNPTALQFENGTYSYVTVGSILEKYNGGGYFNTRKRLATVVFDAVANVKLTAKTGYNFNVYTAVDRVITVVNNSQTSFTLKAGKEYGIVLRTTGGTDDISSVPVTSIVDISYDQIVDKTLGIDGQAADAATVGTKFGTVDSFITQVNGQIINVFNPANVTTGKKTYFATGYKITNLRDQTYSALSEIMPCKPGDVITLKPGVAGTSSATGPSQNYGIVFADADGNILSAVNQPVANSGAPYSATAPENAAQFRFNVNTNYESDLTLKWCTINRGSLSYAIPYGNFEVHRASSNNYGGIKASDKTDSDTQPVRVNSTTGFAYVNLHPASEENRQIFTPAKIYAPKTNKPKAYWRSLTWVRDQNSVYYRSPSATTSFTSRCMPEYLNLPDGSFSGKRNTDAGMYLCMFDAARQVMLSQKAFDLCAINPSALVNPETEKNLLIIGDSFINLGVIPDRIRAKLDAYGLTNIKLIGKRQTDAGNKHEGHGGHAYVDYISNPASLETGHVNPFWHNGTDDFSWYASECGVSAIDYVIIHLGVNDLLDGTSNATICANMAALVGYIHAAFPDCKVIIDGCVIPAMACPSNYNPVDQALKIHTFNAAMEAAANAISNTYFAPVVVFFAAEYAYPYTMQAPCEGSTETIKVLTDYLHPYTPGYYQIADEALWCLLFNITDV